MANQTNPSSRSISLINVPEGSDARLKLEFTYHMYVQDEMVSSSEDSTALDENSIDVRSENPDFELPVYRTFRSVKVGLPKETKFDRLTVRYSLVGSKLEVGLTKNSTVSTDIEGDAPTSDHRRFWNAFIEEKSAGKSLTSLVNFEEDFTVGLIDMTLGDGSLSDDLELLSDAIRRSAASSGRIGEVGYSSEELVSQVITSVDGESSNFGFEQEDVREVSKSIEASRITISSIEKAKPGEGVPITAGADFSIAMTEDLVRTLLLGSLSDPSNPGSLDLAQSLQGLTTATAPTIQKLESSEQFPESPFRRGSIFQSLSSYSLELKTLNVNITGARPRGTNDNSFDLVPLGYLVKRIDLGIMGTGSDSRPAVYFEPVKYFRFVTSVIDDSVLYGHTYRYQVRRLYGVRTWLKNSTGGKSEKYFLVASRPIRSKRDQISILYSEPPLPPADLRFKLDYRTGFLGVEWSQRPRRKSPPVVEYLIFKRSGRSLGEALSTGYRLVDRVVTSKISGQYPNLITGPFEPSTVASGARVDRPRFWYDIEYDRSLVNVYSIVSLDPHGYISNLSQQMIVTFNNVTRKINVELASPSGALLQYPNFFLTKKAGGFSRTHVTGDFSNSLISSIATASGKKRVRLYFNPDARVVKLGSDEVNLFRNKSNSRDPDRNVYYLNAINLSDEETNTIRIRLNRAGSE